MPSVPPPDTALTEPPPPPAAPDPRSDDDVPQWRLWTAPAAILLGFALGEFAAIVITAIGTAGGSTFAHPSPAVSIISDVAVDLAFVGAALYFTVLQGHSRPADFGFRRTGFRLGLRAFVAGGLGYYFVTWAYASIFTLHGSDKLPSELGVSKSTAALVAATVFVCVIAPIAEEFFFRGFLFGALRRMRIVILGREVATWVAAIVTGILFGLAHTGSASPEYLPPLAFLGFVLCLLRWRTCSLYPCIALHSVNNSLAIGVNQLHWNAGEIVALMLGALLVVGMITVPLALRPSPVAPT